jgi:hypothetical protein
MSCLRQNLIVVAGRYGQSDVVARTADKGALRIDALPLLATIVGRHTEP